MPELNNGRYTITEAWRDAGQGRWNFAMDTRANKQVFIKEFLKYRYQVNASHPDHPVIVAYNKKCDAFVQRMSAIREKVNAIAASSGDVVIIQDFFRDGNFLYKTNDKVDFLKWPPDQVHERLSVEQIDTLMVRLVAAIGTLHAANILHCDLKPDNIFILQDAKGYYGKVTDFDDSFFLNAVPNSTEIVGTPEYMSPEMCMYIDRGEDAPPFPFQTASDIFAIGLIYHEFLSGALPALPAGYTQVAAAVLQGKPLVLSKKIDFNRRSLISRMLKRDPRERLQNCSAVITEMQFIKARDAIRYPIYVTQGGQPAPGKKVTLYASLNGEEEKIAQGLTDRHGHVAFAGLPTTDIRVECEGKSDIINTANSKRHVIVLSPPAGLKQPVQVKVTSAGAPVPGATVWLVKDGRVVAGSDTNGAGLANLGLQDAGQYDLAFGALPASHAGQAPLKKALGRAFRVEDKAVLQALELTPRPAGPRPPAAPPAPPPPPPPAAEEIEREIVINPPVNGIVRIIVLRNGFSRLVMSNGRSINTRTQQLRMYNLDGYL